MEDPEDDENYEPVHYPAPLHGITTGAVSVGLLTWFLDISMGVVAISAWVGVGKPKEDETNPVKMTWITWNTQARQIQAAEIALACIGFIWNNVHIQFRSQAVAGLWMKFTTANAKPIRREWIRKRIPADIAMLTTYLLLVVYQSNYVPILGRKELPECVTYGTKLKQCRMVNGTWICAIMFCIFHATSLALDIEIYRRLFYPDNIVPYEPPVELARVVTVPEIITVPAFRNPGAPDKDETNETIRNRDVTDTTEITENRDVRWDSDSDVVGVPSKIE